VRRGRVRSAPERNASSREAATPPARIDPVPSGPDLDGVDAALGEAQGLLAEARFEEALDRLAMTRSRLLFEDDAASRTRRARLESLAGTAEVALGREDVARSNFEAALRADPEFRLDARTTSPKVMRAFDAARAAQEGAP
jgi:hypothetical protein